MRQDLNSILDGDGYKDGIIQKLEELKRELGAKMELQLKPKYKVDLSEFELCKLPGLISNADKLVLTYMSKVKLVTTGTLVNKLMLDKSTLTRTLNRLVSLGYILKVRGGTYEMVNHNIF